MRWGLARTPCVTLLLNGTSFFWSATSGSWGRGSSPAGARPFQSLSSNSCCSLHRLHTLLCELRLGNTEIVLVRMTLKAFILVMRLGIFWLLRLFGAGGNISGHYIVFILGCSFQPWVLIVRKTDWRCGYDSELQNSRGIVKTKECGLSFKRVTSDFHFPKNFPKLHWILKWLVNTNQNFLVKLISAEIVKGE